MDVRAAVLCATFNLLISDCWGTAEYEQFPGFESTSKMTSTHKTTKPITPSSPPTHQYDYDELSTHRKDTSIGTTVEIKNITENKNTTVSGNKTKSSGVEKVTSKPSKKNHTKIYHKPYVCLEDEFPANIGPYEVPTQRDLALQVKTTLKTLFSSYHKKVLFFLNDIKEATKATAEVEGNCPARSRNTYKQCVKHVSNQCRTITKNLVSSLELQRHDVEAFTETSICNLSSMRADPVELIKILAMEEASLEFALAGFLRLLSACEHYCHNDNKIVYVEKPTRHMSDQDLVIKHFLTRKNYIQLLKGSK